MKTVNTNAGTNPQVLIGLNSVLHPLSCDFIHKYPPPLPTANRNSLPQHKDSFITELNTGA
jgi:hypothetical protein